MKDRSPAVSGAFYPSDPKILKNELSNLFSGFPNTSEQNAVALIVPHAGYHFSGKVAAAAYSHLNPEAKYENIFLIGASHRKYYEGVSIYPSGNYITPLGRVKVNDQIALELMKSNYFIYFDPESDYNEHTLEVQLPFLQHRLKNPFNIVPLLIGNRNSTTYKSLAEALMPWFTKENLFIISTDFSHYPSSTEAENIDLVTADAILTGDPDFLRKTCKESKNIGIKNLATVLCGEMGVETLMQMMKSQPEISFKKIMYQHSGYANPEKEHEKVVGYWAIGAFRPKKDLELTEMEKNELLIVAKESITDFVENGAIKQFNNDFSATLQSNFGAFVSVYTNGNLRGCIGNLESKKPLWQLVKEMSVAAATKDHRFDPIKNNDLEDVKIEISVLSPLKKIDSIDDFELGKHGIYILKGDNSGTFLPQVAEKRNWTKEEFLGHCSQDKAKIGWDGWKDAETFTFEAVVFHD